MRRISSLLVISLTALPMMAKAEQAAAPKKHAETLDEALTETGEHIAKGARFLGKAAKWGVIGTTLVVGGSAAYSGVAGVLGADHVNGVWFDPSMMNQALEYGQKFGMSAVHAATNPDVWKVTAAGAGAYAGIPLARYGLKQGYRAWLNNPYAGDMTFALAAVGGSIALGNTHPGNMAINYIIGQGSSFGARAAIKGTTAAARAIRNMRGPRGR